MSFAATIEAARNGSPHALGELLESCGGYIRVIARKRLPRGLRGRVRASSLVQETYLRACRHFDRFRGRSEPQLLAWLRQIMLRCLIDCLRRPEFRVSVLSLSPDLAARAAAPGQLAADAERAQALDRALDRLPTHYRLAIELHRFERLPFADIGHVLNCSAEAARKVWARALARLGEELKSFQ